MAGAVLAGAATGDGDPARLRFEPPGPAAGDFNTGDAGESSGGGLDADQQRQLVSTIAERWPGLSLSPRMSRAAGAYALATTRLSVNELPPSLTEHLLHWAGYPVPPYVVSVISTSEESMIDLFDHMAEVIGHSAVRPTEVGVGCIPSSLPPFRWRWAVIFSRRQITLDPFPAVLAPGRTAVLRFRLAPGLSRAEVVLLYPDGIIRKQSPTAAGEHLLTPVRGGTSGGVLWVQIMASGANEAAVVAQMPVAIGRPRPLLWQGSPIPDESDITTADAAEARFAMLLHQERVRFGLGTLTPDPRLAYIARAHSLDMVTSNFFSHVSPTHGDLGQRLLAAGYRSYQARENISFTSTVHAGMASLMASPSHRANILDPSVERFGIGVVAGHGQETMWMATQVFAKPVEIRSPAEVESLVAQVLAQQRRTARQKPLATCDALEHWAGQLLKQVLISGELDEGLLDAARLEMDPRQLAAVTIQAEMVMVTDLDELVLSDRVAAATLRQAGIAAACTDGINLPTYTVVVLLAGAVPLPEIP
jgi:uncharacterized protein YkwD